MRLSDSFCNGIHAEVCINTLSLLVMKKILGFSFIFGKIEYG